MLVKHIDFESKNEDHVSFRRMPKGKELTMVGGIPITPPDEARREEPAEDESSQIARQILESLENSEEH
jgi:hypothetical protein